MTKTERACHLVKAFPKVYPNAHCELDFKTPLQLLVATILSAQCTDKRVNLVTPALFARYRSAKDFAEAKPNELEKAIQSTGFFRNKAKSIRAAAAAIESNHKGKVPKTMAELNALPESAAKPRMSFSAMLSPSTKALLVDTHVARLSERLGLTKEKPGEDRARPDEVDPEGALDRLESLAHLAQAAGAALRGNRIAGTAKS